AGEQRAAAAQTASRQTVLSADELLERGLIPDRVEVRIVGRQRAKRLRSVDRDPKMLDRFFGLPREALAAGDVVEQAAVLGMLLEQRASAVGRLGVLPGRIERVQRGPDLPALGLVRLAGRASERHDRRLRLLREGGPLDVGPDEDERAGRGFDPVPVELEGRATPLDEVELLLRVAFVVPLVVLVDDPIAGV